MIDLHVHSNRSDGSFSPKELVDYAIKKGLSAFALTDHDTVDGLEEAMRYAEELRKTQGTQMIPEVIPGIELSTEYEGRDVHILGLSIDYHNPAFCAYLKDFVASRNARNEKMCSLLAGAGISISYAALQEEFPDAVITRAHYAKYLLNHGYVKSMNEAFERYIGDRCPYFVPREKVSPEMAVELILNAGGIPILAHPILYHMSDARLDTLVARLKAIGLIGIEAIYSTYHPAEERQIRKLADKYRLRISGGSDFHGANKPGLDLGNGYGKLYVPDEVWTNLQKCKKNLLFTDLDGTLLNNAGVISPAMRDALTRMINDGHQLILSSGRPLPSMLEVQKTAGLTFPNMLMSANNGALVYDCDNDKPILEYMVSGSDAAYIVNKAKAAGLHIHGYTAKEILCTEDNAEVRYYTSRVRLPIQFVEDLPDALSGGTYKLLIICLDDRARLEAFRDDLLKNSDLSDRLQLVFSNSKYLEILSKDAGKGNALQFVTDYLGVLRTHTYAAGDEENDISMLRAAHVGIAMANAIDKVKDAADVVTEKSNDEDGLLEIVEGF